MEFLAEKELVTIIPNFSLDKIYLIGVRALAGHLPEAPAGGTGVWERPGRWGFCGRRLAPLCSHVSVGKPGGGFGVPSSRGPAWTGLGRGSEPGDVWGGTPGGTHASQVFPRFLPAALRETGLRCAARCGQPHRARADVGCPPRSVTTGAWRCICTAIYMVPVLFPDSREVQERSALTYGACFPLAGGSGALQPRPAGAGASVAGDQPEAKTEVSAASSGVDGCG